MTHASFRRLKLLSLIGAGVLLIALAGVAVAGNNGGSGLGFGSTQQVVINETAGLQHLGYTGFTIEAWVRPLAPFNGQRSVIRNNNDYSLFFDGGAVRVEAWPGGDGTSSYNRAVSTSVITVTDQWVHVAATWITPSVQIYVNGSPVGSTPTSQLGGTPETLWLGRDQTLGQGIYGYIDEVRIWNTARTADQIRSTMFLALTGSESNLVGYWQFNEGSGQTTADVSGNGNTGTLGSTAGADVNDPAWIAASLVPLGSLNATYQNGVAGMWAGRPNTASDGVVTGLDIADVTFLNAVGDDIIFGHNNAAFHGGVTDNLATTPHAKKRWARLWELDVNDAGTTGGNVDLTFDISDAGGSGSFSSGGSYYLLKRPTGSTVDFSEVSVVSTSVAGDQVTFRVSVTELGSEFTLGATSSSPSAVALTELVAASTTTSVVPWLLGSALGLAALIGWRHIRRRRVPVLHK
jgi:hypothetical protein